MCASVLVKRKRSLIQLSNISIEKHAENKERLATWMKFVWEKENDICPRLDDCVCVQRRVFQNYFMSSKSDFPSQFIYTSNAATTLYLISKVPCWLHIKATGAECSSIDCFLVQLFPICEEKFCATDHNVFQNLSFSNCNWSCLKVH